MKTLDTKYRETLPDIVKGLPFAPLSDDEGASIVGTMETKARKSKKAKLGKNGLYPGEDANIMRWWLSRETSDIDCDTPEARDEYTKGYLLEQRTRETQMQIILALETLALEDCETGPSNVQDCDHDPAVVDNVSLNKFQKSKKPQDLKILLDILADRLSIWQSMKAEETKSAGNVNDVSTKKGPITKSKTVASDVLRQFCIDVVLPLYVS